VLAIESQECKGSHNRGEKEMEEKQSRNACFLMEGLHPKNHHRARMIGQDGNYICCLTKYSEVQVLAVLILKLSFYDQRLRNS